VTVRIGAGRLQELLGRLDRIGKVEQRLIIPEGHDGVVELIIRVEAPP
jgi:hypothetical protein